MRYQVRAKIFENPDYLLFMRENPIWYRLLTRNPELINVFIDEYKKDRKLTIPDKIDKVSMMLQMMNAFM